MRVIEYGHSNLRIAVIAYIICGGREQGKESETVFCKLKRDAPQPLPEQTSTQCQMPKTRTQYSKKAVPSDFTAIFDLSECPKNNTCSGTKNIRQIAFISADRGLVAIKKFARFLPGIWPEICLHKLSKFEHKVVIQVSMKSISDLLNIIIKESK